MELLVMHHNITYMDEVANVLNEEWPRSYSARIHSLQKSSDAYPYSLVLLKDSIVLGYSRLSLVVGKKYACFIESVVVKKSERGKGYGRILMEMTENHAKMLGFTFAYLTTHDKQKFYEHLEYSFCQPIVSLGNQSSLMKDKKFENFFNNLHLLSQQQNLPQQSVDNVQSSNKHLEENVIRPCELLRPPPQPPPPPPVAAQQEKVVTRGSNIYWMRKKL